MYFFCKKNCPKQSLVQQAKIRIIWPPCRQTICSGKKCPISQNPKKAFIGVDFPNLFVYCTYDALTAGQGDQIRQIFAHAGVVYFGQFFITYVAQIVGPLVSTIQVGM
jgi:hypothetical protein